jgi:hypothetical protein
MARYALIAAVIGQPANGTYTKYPRGSTIADTAGNALPGDWVWPSLATAPSPVNMRPLDSAASARMGLPITTLAEIASSPIGGAAGENAGSWGPFGPQG